MVTEPEIWEFWWAIGSCPRCRCIHLGVETGQGCRWPCCILVHPVGADVAGRSSFTEPTPRRPRSASRRLVGDVIVVAVDGVDHAFQVRAPHEFGNWYRVLGPVPAEGWEAAAAGPGRFNLILTDLLAAEATVSLRAAGSAPLPAGESSVPATAVVRRGEQLDDEGHPVLDESGRAVWVRGWMLHGPAGRSGLFPLDDMAVRSLDRGLVLSWLSLPYLVRADWRPWQDPWVGVADAPEAEAVPPRSNLSRVLSGRFSWIDVVRFADLASARAFIEAVAARATVGAFLTPRLSPPGSDGSVEARCAWNAEDCPEPELRGLVTFVAHSLEGAGAQLVSREVVPPFELP